MYHRNGAMKALDVQVCESAMFLVAYSGHADTMFGSWERRHHSSPRFLVNDHDASHKRCSFSIPPPPRTIVFLNRRLLQTRTRSMTASTAKCAIREVVIHGRARWGTSTNDMGSGCRSRRMYGRSHGEQIAFVTWNQPTTSFPGVQSLLAIQPVPRRRSFYSNQDAEWRRLGSRVYASG